MALKWPHKTECYCIAICTGWWPCHRPDQFLIGAVTQWRCFKSFGSGSNFNFYLQVVVHLVHEMKRVGWWNAPALRCWVGWPLHLVAMGKGPFRALSC